MVAELEADATVCADELAEGVWLRIGLDVCFWDRDWDEVADSLTELEGLAPTLRV